MGDVTGSTEPLDIDARMNAEKLADAGRAALGRIVAATDRTRLDVVALVWMLGVVAYTGATIYSGLRFSIGDGFPGGTSGWWLRAEYLSLTGGPVLALECVAGVVLALFAASAVSRLALWVAAAGGGWTVGAAVLGVAVTFHDKNPPIRNTLLLSGGRGAAVVGYLSEALLGLVVVAVALRLARDRAAAPHPDTEPQVAEVS